MVRFCGCDSAGGRKPLRAMPISTAVSGRPAKRPAYLVLITALLNQYGVTLLPWRDGLKKFFVDQKDEES